MASNAPASVVNYSIWTRADVDNVTDAVSGWNFTSLPTVHQTLKLLPLVVELKTTRLIVQRILTPLVVACGIAGNLVNMAVLTRRWMKSSTNRYLTALAFCDVIYLSLVFTMSLSHYESLDVQSSNVYQRYQYTIGRPLTNTFSNVGVWLTLTFTVERYIGVCHPMRGRVWCTPRRAKFIIGVVCLAAAVVTFPEFFEVKVSMYCWFSDRCDVTMLLMMVYRVVGDSSRRYAAFTL